MRTLTLVVLTVLATACGESDATTPTTPTPPITNPTPTPTPTTVTMDGTVRESVPTTNTPVPSATIRITSGAQSGQTRQADGNGYYVFDGLTAGAFTVEVSAPNYGTTTASVTRQSSGQEHFTLTPTRREVDQTETGEISASAARCETRAGSQPCVIVAMDVHHPGQIEANLDWLPTTTNLDLDVYRDDTRLTTSQNVSLNYEAVSIGVEPGRYQLRVYYRDGVVATRYTLRVRRPN